MAEFKAIASGAEVNIKIADFEDAMALKGAVFRELAKLDIKIGADTDIDGALLAQALMAIDSSPEVQAALFVCLGRCTYAGQAITPKTFNPAAAREDFYEVATACLKENLAPFFVSLFSQLKAGMEAVKRAETILKS